MHGNVIPTLSTSNPKAARIAQLSAEYLDAEPDRRAEIGEEIAALISGRIIPFPIARQ